LAVDFRPALAARLRKVRQIRNELEQRGHNPVLFFLKCMETTEADDRLLCS